MIQHRIVKSLEALMLDYLAVRADVQNLESLTQVKKESDSADEKTETEKKKKVFEGFGEQVWHALEARLNVPRGYVAEYWFCMTPERRFELWLATLKRRVETVHASPVFTQETTRRIGAGALRMLEEMLDKGAIRNPAELLAIAKLVQPYQQQNPGLVVNNFGDMKLGDGQSLPGNGEVMRITMHPSVAERLTRPAQERGTRIIDADMVTAEELRAYQGPEHATQEG